MDKTHAKRKIACVSTHSRAEAAAHGDDLICYAMPVSTHSRAEAAANIDYLTYRINEFQHTAARRRLHAII